jgi:polyphosphate:AMP phosphotransferase
MFEAAELGRKIEKAEYEVRLADLRTRLLELQRRLVASDASVVVIIGGVEGAGKAAVLDKLTQWLDVRHVDIRTFGAGPETDEEAQRPEQWRYFRALPARGRIGLFLGSWYTHPILDRVLGDMKGGAFERALARIHRLERMLADDGTVILKFWLHLTEQEQRARFEKLEADKLTRWRVTKEDWRRHEHYRRFSEVAETAIRATDTGSSPWLLVEAADPRYRDLTIATTIADALERRMGRGPVEASVDLPPIESTPPIASEVTILDRADLSSSIRAEEYEALLGSLQGDLGKRTRKLFEAGRSTVIVFEGWDAAGKGGAIRRVTQAIDARLLNVIQIAAPTDEERAHHYLWRFWRHVPRAGRVTIYDRSWYGRVLVERVEGFASEPEWKRAYREIDDFEEQLADFGVIVVKLFLHIGKEEQLARFEARESTAYKRHKITDEDWRNREKWDRYLEAVNEMVARTSTSFAPWTIIPANDKRFARVEVLRAILERLRA